MPSKATLVTSVHPNEKVASRRRDLLDYSLENDRLEHSQQASSSTSSSSRKSTNTDSNVIMLSAEGVTKLQQVADSALASWSSASFLPETRAKLRSLIRAEVSSGHINIPPTNIPQRLLRDTLLESFSTTSTRPGPDLRSPKERDKMEMYLTFYTMLKAPGTSLPPQLQKLKSEIVREVVKMEREDRAELSAQADKEKRRMNDYLRRNGEPEINFDLVRHYRDPDDNIMFMLPDTFRNLEQRKPEIWSAMLEMWQVFTKKAIRVDGYFKKA